MQSIGQTGDVTCTPVLPNEYGSNTAATMLGASSTQVATQSLGAGSSYLVLAYPHVVIGGGSPGQHVEVDCTLSVPAGSGTPPPANPTTTTKTLAVDVNSSGHSQTGTIPLGAAGGVVDEHPAGDRELHRLADRDTGAGGHGRHDDQRDPDRQQQLRTRPQYAQAMSTAQMNTSLGTIAFELFDEDAPETVANFRKLAGDNFYDGIIFHRVISGFMVQGGCPEGSGRGGPGYTFADEINDHKVVRGALAMANAGPNTNGSQFFIVTTEAAPWLDGKHTVFGKVTDGMDTVDAIEGVPTGAGDRPVDPVVIESIDLA